PSPAATSLYGCPAPVPSPARSLCLGVSDPPHRVSRGMALRLPQQTSPGTGFAQPPSQPRSSRLLQIQCRIRSLEPSYELDYLGSHRFLVARSWAHLWPQDTYCPHSLLDGDSSVASGR